MNKKLIEFRAWHKINKIMLPVYCIDFKGVSIRFGEPAFIANEGHGCWFIKDCVFMQYIGLKDKHGKKIFEGDIIQTNITFHKGIIEFDKGLFGINWDYGSDQKRMLGAWGNRTNLRGLHDGYNEEVEVIGNIYETKKFLNKVLKEH